MIFITLDISLYVKINSVNFLYLIIDDVVGPSEKNNGNRYLILDSTDKNKKVLIKYTKLWDRIKYLIKTIKSSKEGEYRKDFMKIKFNSDDNLPLNKTLKLHNMTIIIRFVFEEDSKYYSRVFLDECLCKL